MTVKDPADYAAMGGVPQAIDEAKRRGLDVDIPAQHRPGLRVVRD
jgi:hypothetical protein